MADFMRSSSFLPTIKCSSCARDIQIAMMGEHICSGPPSAGEPTPPLDLNNTFDRMPYNQQSYSNGSNLLKPGRTMPPRVDTSAANRPFFQQDQLTPASSASPSRSASPLTPHDRLRLPFGKSSRANDSSPVQRPISPALLSSNLDSAFPRFPTPKVTGSPRLKSAYGAHSPRIEQTDPMMFASPNSKAYMNPNVVGSVASLQKVVTNTPGPFAIDSRKVPSHEELPMYNRKPSMGRPGDIISPPLTAEPEHIDRTLSTSSGHSRTSTNSSNHNFPMPPRNKGYGILSPEVREDTQESWRQEAIRSQTFPRRKESLDFHASRRNQSISSHRSRESNDRGRKTSISGPDTSRALPPRGASLIRGRSGHQAGDLPPLPNINLEAEFGANNPYHSASNSQSSTHSYTSSTSAGSKSSSRSSPPSTVESDYHRRQQSNPRMSDLMSEITSSMAHISPHEMYPRPSDLEPVKEQEPYSPLSPAFQSPDYAPNPVNRLSPTPRVPPPAPLKPRNRDPSPAPLNPRLRNLSPAPMNGFQRSHTAPLLDQNKPLPAPRRPATSKGNCKSCTLPIKGKSVSSADGRLTGRYHKPCFVCTTCRAPFLTSEFYVHNDAPYCEHHYHQLNNSMCSGCDRGIEGQYLESEKKEKFHPSCLNCADCKRNLRHDYFEMGGKIYCERDAFRRAQESRKGGLGAGLGAETTRMERRTTRLMMM
ncbi:putative lim domain-containing protein [Botrytis fragariae]|uniref:Putative lim domain-containing protein n=1 Tax=Botrytis fragariae TaxID=1964551 RepID=A0A8H6EK61_9HELO|nr:putative lim domain-containing protein [Botrytis fragariae]KAF5874830.1 putative lim domain-containing protein [Botrytis fragariae]